jgi:hypothetical protein
MVGFCIAMQFNIAVKLYYFNPYRRRMAREAGGSANGDLQVLKTRSSFHPTRGIVRGRASRICAARRMPAFGAPKPLYPRRSTISKKNRSSKAWV